MLGKKEYKELIIATQNGDDKARRILENEIVSHSQYMSRWYRSCVSDLAELDDLAMQAALKAIVAIEKKKYNPKRSFPAYLTTVVQNQAIDLQRKNKTYNRAREMTMKEGIDYGTQEEIHRRDLQEIENYALKSLQDMPEKYAKAFSYYHLKGLNYPQIAEHMNIKLNTLKTYIRYARLELKERIETDLEVTKLDVLGQ